MSLHSRLNALQCAARLSNPVGPPMTDRDIAIATDILSRRRSFISVDELRRDFQAAGPFESADAAKQWLTERRAH